MEAKELMIGGWVQHQGTGKYMQVSRIDANHFACGFPYCYEYNNPYAPVLLTPEILEKNGFAYNSENKIATWKRLTEDGKDLEETISIHLNTHVCWVESFRYCGQATYEGRTYFVHELQRALRLCRIDKEIVL